MCQELLYALEIQLWTFPYWKNRMAFKANKLWRKYHYYDDCYKINKTWQYDKGETDVIQEKASWQGVIWAKVWIRKEKQTIEGMRKEHPLAERPNGRKASRGQRLSLMSTSLTFLRNRKHSPVAKKDWVTDIKTKSWDQRDKQESAYVIMIQEKE